MRFGLTLTGLALVSLGMTACAEKDREDEQAEDGDSGILTTTMDGSTGEGEASGSDDGADGNPNCPPGGCLDTLPSDTEGTGCMEGDQCGTCEAPEHVPCDGTNDPIKAMGLNCGGGEPIVTATIDGNPAASGTMAAFGTGNAFPPQEGSEYAVIGSGFVADLNMAGGLLACSQDLGAYDPMTTLPAPIRTNDVGAVTCTENPALIGTGDCSNSIQTQFTASASGAFDYTEIRFTGTVPQGVSSISYDFAFFSYEYPAYWQSQFNDIYIGWLESEAWTGNISFDEMGNPISVNAGFFDFLDADTGNTDMATGAPHPTCPIGAGCSAPELAGTCMVGHGGTKWLTSTAPVAPGEEITVVFAVMDLGDSVLDSYVFLDNFLWGCDGDLPPSTVPVD